MGILDPRLEQEIFEAAYNSLQGTAAKLGGIYTPQWNARNDVAKTLLTVASAVLVISITLSSRVTVNLWLLRLCWTGFLISILCSLATLWLSLGLYSLPSFIVAARTELREWAKEIDPAKPDAGPIIDRLFTARLNTMEKLDRWAIRTLKCGFILFLVALICTAIVGWTQRPSLQDAQQIVGREPR
jgi:hypothetical protein